MKQSARELQSALRRSKAGELSIDINVSDYITSRKIAAVLKEASLISASIFHTFLSFLSPSTLKKKPSKWSLVSKLVRKGSAEEQKMNELDRVDLAVSNLLLQGSKEDAGEQKIRSALLNLELLDDVLESFEDGLQCLFRSLLHTRVSFLNILSH
ncbi:uncharacterized protein LOC120192815 [Hibiscus syriacus]|uniref:uncharacterized protein LOC120192815 n=1 Tax=Hibiscus syriacus TaxID=106335 RepID=UPI0019232E4F|nr:uncharacterized protein LOC120192815 [Hibiscus syriacus]